MECMRPLYKERKLILALGSGVVGSGNSFLLTLHFGGSCGKRQGTWVHVGLGIWSGLSSLYSHERFNSRGYTLRTLSWSPPRGLTSPHYNGIIKPILFLLTMYLLSKRQSYIERRRQRESSSTCCLTPQMAAGDWNSIGFPTLLAGAPALGPSSATFPCALARS